MDLLGRHCLSAEAKSEQPTANDEKILKGKLNERRIEKKMSRAVLALLLLRAPMQMRTYSRIRLLKNH